VIVLFAAASFLTAALLFLVQPLVGRMVLPAFGGSPQVWTTSMLFFQVALLVGYGYTHLATTRLPRRVQPWLHLVLVAAPLAVLPIALDVVPSGRGGVTPSLELLAGLVIGVGAPFVLVATSGPWCSGGCRGPTIRGPRIPTSSTPQATSVRRWACSPTRWCSSPP
jgi:hypothetical protein